jgi:hypothetical protein
MKTANLKLVAILGCGGNPLDGCRSSDPTSQASNGTNSATAGPRQGKPSRIARVLALIGLLLSPGVPLDPILNIPIAVGIGCIAAQIYRPAFAPTVAVAYIATNIVGILLMRIWGPSALGQQGASPYTRLRLMKDSVVAVGYTGAICVLSKLGVFSTALIWFKHLAAVFSINSPV